MIEPVQQSAEIINDVKPSVPKIEGQRGLGGHFQIQNTGSNNVASNNVVSMFLQIGCPIGAPSIQISDSIPSKMKIFTNH